MPGYWCRSYFSLLYFLRVHYHVFAILPGGRFVWFPSPFVLTMKTILITVAVLFAMIVSCEVEPPFLPTDVLAPLPDTVFAHSHAIYAYSKDTFTVYWKNPETSETILLFTGMGPYKDTIWTPEWPFSYLWARTQPLREDSVWLTYGCVEAQGTWYVCMPIDHWNGECSFAICYTGQSQGLLYLSIFSKTTWLQHTNRTPNMLPSGLFSTGDPCSTLPRCVVLLYDIFPCMATASLHIVGCSLWKGSGSFSLYPGGEMVNAYPKYIEMVELNYLDIPLAGSIPVLDTNS